MRYGMAVGILAAGLISGGCGGERSKINKVIGAYGRALAAGDGDRAVGQMADEHALERTGDARLRRINGRWLLDDAHTERR